MERAESFNLTTEGIVNMKLCMLSEQSANFSEHENENANAVGMCAPLHNDKLHTDYIRIQTYLLLSNANLTMCFPGLALALLSAVDLLSTLVALFELAQR